MSSLFISGEGVRCSLGVSTSQWRRGVQSSVCERDSQARVPLGLVQPSRDAPLTLYSDRDSRFSLEQKACIIRLNTSDAHVHSYFWIEDCLTDINLECLQRLGRLTCRSRATFDEILGGPHRQPEVNSRRLECSGHDLSGASSVKEQETTCNSKTQNLFCTGSGDKDSERVEKGRRGVGQGAAGACGGSAHPLLESGSPPRPCRPLPNPVSPPTAMVT